MKKAVRTILTLSCSLMLLLSVSCSEDKTAVGSPPDSKAEMAGEGAKIFRENCQVCHGEGGQGDICPNLTDKEWKYGGADAQLLKTISKGRPGGMPAWESKLGEEKIKRVISYIRSINEN